MAPRVSFFIWMAHYQNGDAEMKSLDGCVGSAPLRLNEDLYGTGDPRLGLGTVQSEAATAFAYHDRVLGDLKQQCLILNFNIRSYIFNFTGLFELIYFHKKKFTNQTCKHVKAVQNIFVPKSCLYKNGEVETYVYSFCILSIR